jgi:hypothetical protein
MSNKAETIRRIAREFHKIALGRKDDVSRLVREYIDYEKGRMAAARSVMPDETKNGIHPNYALGEWCESNPYDKSKKFCQSVALLVAVTDEYFISINRGYEKLFEADELHEEIELASLPASHDIRLKDEGFGDVLESEFETVKAAWGIGQSEAAAAVDHKEMVASIIDGLRTVAVAQGDEPPKVKEPPKEASNRFVCDGEFWSLRFDDRDISPVKDVLGMQYISYLLARPGECIKLDVLRSKVCPPPPDALHDTSEAGSIAGDYGTGGSNGKLEAKDTEGLKQELRNLKKSLEEPSLSMEEKEDNQEKIEKLEKYLSQAKYPTETKGNHSMRTTMQKTIERAKEKIAGASGGGNLSKHLDSVVLKDGEYVYLGEREWET